jgi:hypothetical protein
MLMNLKKKIIFLIQMISQRNNLRYCTKVLNQPVVQFAYS